MFTKIINKMFICIVDILWSTPVIGRWIKKRFILVSTYLACIYRSRNINKLRKTLNTVLDSNSFREVEKARFWWFLMRFAVTCEQEHRLMSFEYKPDIENNLVNLGMSGPSPNSGYDASYVYTSFSIWYFERGLLNNAIDMIRLAVEADSKWAYPEFMLGWYGLFSEDVDSVEHFGAAVRRDWSMLSKIRNDYTCKQFPSVIKKVSQAVVVQKGR